MGSPVSVTVADLVMEDVESRALSSFASPPLFWKRYVDDTCCAISEIDFTSFFSHLNTIESTIQFTCECEVDGLLSFLDVQLQHHPDGSISTSVYRKPTHTDRYLDFRSHHPLGHKVSVVRTLFSRADRLSSSSVSVSVEEQHITSALRMNGYPDTFISRNRIPSTRPPSAPSPISVFLPYVKGVSESIQRALHPLGISVRLCPPRTLRHLLVNPKDRVDSRERPGVVYRIPCASCSYCYIGETGRTLSCRLKEHKYAVRSRDITSSALAEHWLNTGHSFAWDDAHVVELCQAWHRRRSLEAWHIRSHPHTLNRDHGALSSQYNSLIARRCRGCSSGSRV